METRRPIHARTSDWAQRFATLLTKSNVQPNHISLASIAFSLIAGAAFYASSQLAPLLSALVLLLAVAFIVGRLLCNLFDGMVAVEGGKQTPSGEIYNEFPDRFSDFIIIAAIGLSSESIPLQMELALTAAALSILTAYIRTLGFSSGSRNYFSGPMAKQQRMAVVCVASTLQAVLLIFRPDTAINLLPYSLIILIIGMVITIYRRTKLILDELNSQ